MRGMVYTLVCWLMLATLLPAQDRYVSPWGSHESPFTSWSTAATNIQAALDVASAGDTVWVSNGVYRVGETSGGGMDARVALTKPVSVRSVNGYRETVIEGRFHTVTAEVGSASVRAVYMTNGVLDGFTIRKGSTLESGADEARVGGGLYALGGTQANIRVTGNTGASAGGAWLSTTTVSNGLFVANDAERGPRVKIKRRVKLIDTRLNNGNAPRPEIAVLGTNGQWLINGDDNPLATDGTVFDKAHTVTGSITHAFTITNWGGRPLTLEGVTAQGGDSADFVFDAPLNSEIAPGATASFNVVFDPTETGLRRALYFLANDDSDDDPYAFWLYGTGIQAELRIYGIDGSWITNGTWNPLLVPGTDFGDVRVTSDALTLDWSMTNAGSALLNISGISVTGEQASVFAVTNPVAYPLAVATGGVHELDVAFDPVEPGVFEGVLHVDSDSVGNPYRFLVRGRGVEPWMRVLGTNETWIQNGDMVPAFPDGTDFGECLDGPIAHTFTVTNAGTHLLTLTGTPHVVIGGAHPNDFTVTTQPLSSIATGGVTSLDIEFYPLVATTRTAVVSIYSDDVYYTNAIYQFAVQGQGSESNLFLTIGAGLTGVSASSIEWVDVDLDGWLDLAVAGLTDSGPFTDISLNLGDGSFTNMGAGIAGVQSARMAWADYDGDGYPDLAISGLDGTAAISSIYRNIGGNSFSNIGASLVGVYNGAVSWGDYDNDGDPDLLLAGFDRTNHISRLYINQGNDQFELADQTLVGLRDGRAIWLDSDEDGWLDLILTGDEGSKRVTLLYQNDAGILRTNSTPSGLSALSLGGVSVGNLDQDGKPDIAMVGYSSAGLTGVVYRSTGGVVPFEASGETVAPLWLGTCDWGDYDNDGWDDLAIAGAAAGGGRHVYIYRNENGSLNRIDTGITGIRVASLDWGDFDNDGDLDLAMAGESTNGAITRIYRNISVAPNTEPSVPVNLTASLTNGNQLVMRWDAASDHQTPETNLTYNLYVGTVGDMAGIMNPLAAVTAGTRRVTARGNVGASREWIIRNLPTQQDVVWGVQAVDGGLLGGPFATGDVTTVPPLPDYVITAIDVYEAPFSALVTVSNRGDLAGTAGLLGVWADKTNLAVMGESPDQSATVGSLNAGIATSVYVGNIPEPSAPGTYIFRAFINSDHAESESNYDNNQFTIAYTLDDYAPFWFDAFALTNNVYLRWSNPTNSGVRTPHVLIHHAATNYPANPTDGSLTYEGSAQFYEHSGLTPQEIYYYTIWVSNDGTNWVVPPKD